MPERYLRHEGLHVLRLEGDDYEMGWQHGAYLAEAIGRGPLPFFARYVERLFGHAFGPLAAPAARGLSRTVGASIARRFPSWVDRALDGLADGAKLDRRELEAAVTMPETFLWALSRWMKTRQFALAPRFAVPTFGCTSVAAFGDATSTGTFLHGRNFDYQGVDAWDTEAAVVFHRPKRGRDYVSVSSAGVLFGGVTAMNDAGLTLAVHQHLSSLDVALGGTPVGIVGDVVMREGASLDDARRLLDEHVPNGCWTYLVGSARERAMLCYEVTPKRRAARVVDGGTFGYTNLYLDAELAKTEVFAYPSQWRWNAGRYHRANAALDAKRGSIGPDDLAAILGDPGDPGCRIREAIAAVMTVGSVVFDPDRGLVWVGAGRAPTSARPFVAFDLATRSPRPDLGTLDGGARANAARLPAFEAYRDAFVAHFETGAGAARRHLERAIALAPRESLYHFVAGLLALGEREAEAARDAFTQAILHGHPDAARVASFHLWRGRAYDAMKRRGDALIDYERALPGDPAVVAAAERGLRSPWKLGHVGVEMGFADVVMP